MADQDLLTKFSCMGTQDRDVLVNDLHEILGSQLSREGCVFFLEMSNWWVYSFMFIQIVITSWNS